MIHVYTQARSLPLNDPYSHHRNSKAQRQRMNSGRIYIHSCSNRSSSGPAGKISSIRHYHRIPAKHGQWSGRASWHLVCVLELQYTHTWSCVNKSRGSTESVCFVARFEGTLCESGISQCVVVLSHSLISHLYVCT